MPKPKPSKRQRQLDEKARLEKERNRLRSELAMREKHISEVQDHVDQVRTNATVELSRMSAELAGTQEEIDQIREQAIHDLFRDLLASPAQISLIKVLTLEEDTDLRWLLPLAYYLRDQIGLCLIGEKDEVVTLTEANCDDYTIHEQVSLPCEVRLTKRGFAIGETIIQRPEVTSL